MSPRRAQVRLDPAVAEALQATANVAGRSLTQAANLMLAEALGLAATWPQTPSNAPGAARAHAPTGVLAGRPGVAEARKRAEQHRQARSTRR